MKVYFRMNMSDDSFEFLRGNFQIFDLSMFLSIGKLKYNLSILAAENKSRFAKFLGKNRKSIQEFILVRFADED